jgi:hypothetical protein
VKIPSQHGESLSSPRPLHSAQSGSAWLLCTDLLGLGLVAKSLAPGSGCGAAACSDSTGSGCSENETLFLRDVFLLGCSTSCAAAPSAGVASARRGDESRFKRAGEADDGSAALEADAVVLGRDERLGI